jgi:hypothetical protein
MKRILFVFAFTFMIAGLASSQQKSAVLTVIDSAVYDFGTIGAGEVSHVFKIKNTGESPLVLTQVSPACGCTVADWSREPVMPGKTTDIKATFKPSSNGAFTKTITVLSNGHTGSFMLTIKGMVDTSKK